MEICVPYVCMYKIASLQLKISRTNGNYKTLDYQLKHNNTLKPQSGSIAFPH